MCARTGPWNSREIEWVIRFDSTTWKTLKRVVGGGRFCLVVLINCQSAIQCHSCPPHFEITF